MKKKVLKVDKLEFGIIINGHVEFRNNLIKQKEDTTPIDELLLKLLNEKI